MTDQERLSKQIEQSNPCRDDSDRGYWRKRLRELEQKNENRDNH